MEPNKIERQMRERLNGRKIQPTGHAWDRLDAMLSIAEEIKTKRSFSWLYMVASILIFLSVGLFFYNQENTRPNTSEAVVAIEKETDSNTVKPNAVTISEGAVLTGKTQSSQQVISPASIINNPKSTIAQSEKSLTRGRAEQSATNQKTNNLSGSINKEKAIEFQNSTDVAIKNLPKIETSKEIVVLKSVNTTQDIIAFTEDNTSKRGTISKVKINANSLLSEVDGELNLTFREKVFRKVNKNYKEVKVALANRNNL